MPNRSIAILAACCFAVFASSTSLAQQLPRDDNDLRFDQLPGYANYQEIDRISRKLQRGGRVFKIRWAADAQSLLFQKSGQQLQLNLSTGTIGPAVSGIEVASTPASDLESKMPVGRAEQRTREPSPDGNWLAIYRKNNVFLDSTSSNPQASLAITNAGNARLRFGTGCWVYGEELDQDEAMWWSDDSRKLVFYEVDESGMRDYVLTIDNVKQYTRTQVSRYPKAGSPNPKVSLWVYDLSSDQKKKLSIPGPTDQYLFNIRFVPNSRELLVYRTTRRQNILDVLLINVDSGVVKTIVSEQQNTWQHNRPELRFLADGRRFIWETERTGWKQFELRSLDGVRLNALTDNQNYPVHQIVWVDEANNWFYYSAYSDANPYNLQLHRCQLDGTNCSRITSSPLNHGDFKISPDHQFVVATRQRIDLPVATVVYDVNGREIATLAEGSSEPAKAVGLSNPELFTFTANDGQTEIYGTLHKPSNFSPTKTYPLLVEVYGGPQSEGIENTYRPANPICELGFLVATVGNRGTTGRGKAFESANYLQLGITDLDDQASAVKYLASRPYVDKNRIGIFGHSYGGYLSALALLRYPDVFQAAVAGSPVTDWRNYDTIYTERYMRLPTENPSGYDAGSCVKLARQLKGKLLLVHGLIDNNVHPSNTWQLAQALQDANKRFEMMIYPQFSHGIGSTYEALRWEHFYRHLKPEL
jgi:dipeptidyl-peptidase-4